MESLGINYPQYISSTIYSKCSLWLRSLRFANLPRLFTADCSAGVTTGALSKIQPQGGVPSLQARKQWPGEMVTDDLVWRCLEHGPIDSDCKNGKLQPLRSEWKLFEHVVFLSKTSLWWSGSSTHRVFLSESCREACHHIDHSFQFFWRDATDTPVPLVPSPYCILYSYNSFFLRFRRCGSKYFGILACYPSHACCNPSHARSLSTSLQPHGPTFPSRVTPTVDSKNICNMNCAYN